MSYPEKYDEALRYTEKNITRNQADNAKSIKGDIFEGTASEEVYDLIKSISFPNNKAKHLIGMAGMLMSDFGGSVPSEPAELEKLPGVGRKTANVIASVIYDKPVIAVDTHVFRVSRRIGLSDGATVEAVERDLTEGFAPELRPKAHHWLILHGRYVCTAKKPHCDKCGLREVCGMLVER